MSPAIHLVMFHHFDVSSLKTSLPKSLLFVSLLDTYVWCRNLSAVDLALHNGIRLYLCVMTHLIICREQLYEINLRNLWSRLRKLVGRSSQQAPGRRRRVPCRVGILLPFSFHLTGGRSVIYVVRAVYSLDKWTDL